MKKSDIVLILIIAILGFVILFLFKKNNNVTSAVVYYDDEVVLRVLLDKKAFYDVKGELGNIKIETDVGKIRVKEEVSPRHLCSLQGWVYYSYTPIVCLPNKIVIKIDGSSLLDTVVG